MENIEKWHIASCSFGKDSLAMILRLIEENKPLPRSKGKGGEGEQMKFYWFEFADGYRCCVAGMSKQELRVEESKYGKLLRKVEA